MGRHEPGFPLIRQHVGVGFPVRAEPPAEVTDIRHPRPVAARGGQLRASPMPSTVSRSKTAPAVFGAVDVEPLQVPDPRAAVEAHASLELERTRPARAANALVNPWPLTTVHLPAPAARTGADGPRSTLMYCLVDSCAGVAEHGRDRRQRHRRPAAASTRRYGAGNGFPPSRRPPRPRGTSPPSPGVLRRGRPAECGRHQRRNT